jgi:YD repeat-containing protein
VTDANGTVIHIRYDGLGRLTSTAVELGRPRSNRAVTSFQYDGIGQITEVRLPNDAVLTFAYNAAKRLTSMLIAPTKKLKSVNAGNITEVDATNSGEEIVLQMRRTFDELSRVLKNIGAADQETLFDYDKLGNITKVTDPRSKEYGYTPAN